MTFRYNQPRLGSARPSAPARYQPKVSTHESGVGLPLGGAIQAAAGYRYESANPDGLPDFSMTREQQEVDYMVRTVGWAGFIVLLKALMGSQCPWTVKKREGSDLVDVEDPRLQAAANLIRPPSRSVRQLRYRSIALQASVAEHGIWPMQTPTRGLVFDIAHPNQLKRSPTSPDMFAVATRRDARPGGPGWNEFPLQRLRRHWVPDDEWPDEAQPTLWGAINELRLYHTAILELIRAGQSRMLMNGLLWIPTDPENQEGSWAAPAPPDEDDTDGASPVTLTNIKKLVRDFATQGAKAIKDHRGDDVASRLPYPFPHFAKPEYMELGRSLSKDTLDGLEEIVAAGCRGINFPTQYVVSGAGTSNHWGDAEQRRDLNERGIIPDLETNDLMWSEYGLRPILALTRAGRLIGDDDVDDYFLVSDTSGLTTKSDSLQRLSLAWNAGIAGRDWMAEQLGVGDDDMLEIPVNVTDWEAWLYSRASAARATAEVAGDFPEQGIGPATEEGTPPGELPGGPGLPTGMTVSDTVAAGALKLIRS